MFGYVVVNQQEMKFKDYGVYRSFYCGLCRELKAGYGLFGQLSLTYDMTFVELLLSALYEPPTQRGTTFCAVHPVVKQQIRRNEFTRYAADMNVLLTYYKCLDDWSDDRDVLKRSYAALLSPRLPALLQKYPRQCRQIREGLASLHALEKQGEKDIDKMSGTFGGILGSIFAPREDVWKETLEKLGFYLGKFIYILDAYEDVEKDRKKGSYNPFLEICSREEFDQEVKTLLLLMATEACRQYEHLPVLRYREILGNILYSGIWCKYYALAEKKEEKSHV